MLLIHKYVFRRTDFEQFSKFWIDTLVNESFFEAAMDHYRAKHPKVSFLVVSDDIEWCKAKLVSTDTFHVESGSPEGIVTN